MPTLPKGAIRVEHVWKKFRADRTAPLFYDQFLRMRRSFTNGTRKDFRWVLKDISLSVEPGGTNRPANARWRVGWVRSSA